MPLSCDLHNNYFFPLAICGYWVTLTPNKLVFRHLIHLTRGEQPWCRPAQVTSKPCGFIKVVTLNLSSTCEGRMGFPPCHQLAVAWWGAQGRGSGGVCLSFQQQNSQRSNRTCVIVLPLATFRSGSSTEQAPMNIKWIRASEKGAWTEAGGRVGWGVGNWGMRE